MLSYVLSWEIQPGNIREIKKKISVALFAIFHPQIVLTLLLSEITAFANTLRDIKNPFPLIWSACEAVLMSVLL